MDVVSQLADFMHKSGQRCPLSPRDLLCRKPSRLICNVDQLKKLELERAVSWSFELLALKGGGPPYVFGVHEAHCLQGRFERRHLHYGGG
jgi:hypothetical protein